MADSILTRLTQWCADHEGIRAALLSSTRTIPDARLDRFSRSTS